MMKKLRKTIYSLHRAILLITLQSLLITLCSVNIVQNVNAGQFAIAEFGGLNTVEDALLIPLETSPDMDNVDISADGNSISRRDGQTKLFDITYPTNTVNSFGSIVNNSYDRLLIGYGNHVSAVDTAYNERILISTSTPGYVWDFVQWIGKTYYTNGYDTPGYTDGYSVWANTSMPRGKSLAVYNNTFFVANSTDNKGRIYYSRYGDPLDWTTGVASYDGRSFDAADYGQEIVDLQPLDSSLLVLCSGAIKKLIGDANPYQLVDIDKSVGCKSKGSVSQNLGWVYFFGSDGHYYRTDGADLEDLTRLSILDDMKNTGISQRSNSYSTLTTDYEFNTGYTSYTMTSNNSIVISSVVYDNFDDNDLTSGNTWFFETGLETKGATVINNTSSVLKISTSSYDSSDTWLFSTNNSFRSKNYYDVSFDLCISTVNTNNFLYFYPVYSPGVAEHAVIFNITNSSPDTKPRIAQFSYIIDEISAGKSFAYNDFNFDSPIVMQYNSTYTFRMTYNENDVSMSINEINIVSGTISGIGDVNIPSDSNMAINYTALTGANGLFYIDNIITRLTPNDTAFFITPPINTVGASGFDLMSAINTLDGGNIQYSMITSSWLPSESYLKSTNTWVTVVNNTIPSVSTNTYAFIKSSFTVTRTTQTPSLDAITLNWYGGTPVTRDMTSCWYDGRLYVGCMATSGSSYNDKIFVYDPELGTDKNGNPMSAWWNYKTGVYPNAMTVWKDKFLVASSSYGCVNQMGTGDTDLGDNINAYYYTKMLSIDNNPAITSSYDLVSFLTKRQTTGILDVYYYQNGNTVSTDSIELSMTGGYPIHVDTMRFPDATNSNIMQFKISNRDGCNFTFYGMSGSTREKPLLMQREK